ncbi:TRAP transporter substrate-binding protein DctP [Marinovum algicola]|jgi:TRAP-type C4-dicarboxylate transport system substrate-binding protein|uniref:TRAP transporter substrate-binding protein DctP n=1 Tax=Marinovum algicola TaxID=42444 RepID=UPI0024B984A1|nr:TRAP transporter substrate-binding protein DctP [Marinovum algicola]
MKHQPIKALGAAAALTILASGAQAQEISWDLALYGSPAFRVAGESFAEYVNENSGGKMEITVHNGTLSPTREVLDNVSIGAFELGYVISSYHPGKNPLLSVLDLPFLPIPTMEDRLAVADLVYDNPHVKKEFAKWGVVPVMTVVQPNYEVMGKGAAPTALTSFDGMRMKATSGIGNALAVYGASLVNVSGPEQYNALQTGVIDAVAATPSAHGGYKLYELSDWYTTGMAAGTAHVTLVGNEAAYAALPDDMKALLAEAKAHANAATIKAQNAAAAQYEPELEKRGLAHVTITPEMIATLRKEAAQPVWDAYVADLEGKGLPGQEMLDLVLNAGM